MSLDCKAKDKPSTLASRPSFFGGVVSTRQASAVSTWKPPKATDLPEAKGSGVSNISKTAKYQQGSANTLSQTARPAASQPSVDPILLKQQRLKASRNFDSDSDTEADKSEPDAYSQALTKLEQQVSKQTKEAEARRPQKPRHLDSTPQQRPVENHAALSPGKQHFSKNRVVLPKGKAGAASRKMALAPQAISLSRKQMADRGIRQAVDSVRHTAPSPPPGVPKANPSRPNPTQSHTTMSAAAAKRMHSSSNVLSNSRQQLGGQSASASQSQLSKAGRPNAMQGSLQQTRDFRSQPDVQQMPAWMQKARAAMAGQKRSRRDEPAYEDDFVVDDGEQEDWRQALKAVTRYDPTKFNDSGFDDRSMEANWKQIQAEERRSARLGRDDDAKAEMEELRHQEEKKRKKKRTNSNGLLQQ